MAIKLEHDFACAAEALWSVVGIPGRADWVPGVSDCVFDGEVRRLTMSGAGELAERILSIDDDARCIRYSCIESTPPLGSHLAEIQVEATGEGRCRMTWLTEVEPEAVEPFIVQQMKASLDQLAAMLEQGH